ncbi:hypothetical protein Btru_073344 [Bulinus truncatus]|nr:hypothetical protein Btru_073344 [Bulinus truncatus]
MPIHWLPATLTPVVAEYTHSYVVNKIKTETNILRKVLSVVRGGKKGIVRAASSRINQQQTTCYRNWFRFLCLFSQYSLRLIAFLADTPDPQN